MIGTSRMIAERIAADYELRYNPVSDVADVIERGILADRENRLNLSGPGSLREQIETILAPAIDPKTPYAKVMIDLLVDLFKQPQSPDAAPPIVANDLAEKVLGDLDIFFCEEFLKDQVRDGHYGRSAEQALVGCRKLKASLAEANARLAELNKGGESRECVKSDTLDGLQAKIVQLEAFLEANEALVARQHKEIDRLTAALSEANARKLIGAPFYDTIIW